MKLLKRKSLAETLAKLPELDEVIIESSSGCGDYSSTETFDNPINAADRIKGVYENHKVLSVGIYDGTMTVDCILRA